MVGPETMRKEAIDEALPQAVTDRGAGSRPGAGGDAAGDGGARHRRGGRGRRPGHPLARDHRPARVPGPAHRGGLPGGQGRRHRCPDRADAPALRRTGRRGPAGRRRGLLADRRAHHLRRRRGRRRVGHRSPGRGRGGGLPRRPRGGAARPEGGRHRGVPHLPAPGHGGGGGQGRRCPGAGQAGQGPPPPRAQRRLGGRGVGVLHGGRDARGPGRASCAGCGWVPLAWRWRSASSTRCARRWI